MIPSSGGAPASKSRTPAASDVNNPAVLHADVAVIGGGVIGHCIAWEARASGRSVVLIDDEPGSGASWAAAGMPAPVSELHYQEEDLLELMLESSRRWPAFAANLADAGSGDFGYLTTPTLAVGADAADRRALMDLRAVQEANGLLVEPLTVREARGREPLLSPAISCALHIPADHQVDPRRLIASLRTVLARHGPDTGTSVDGARDGFAVDHRATELLWAGNRVRGVKSGQRLDGPGGGDHRGKRPSGGGHGRPAGLDAAAPEARLWRHPAPPRAPALAPAGDIHGTRPGPRRPRLHRSLARTAL